MEVIIMYDKMIKDILTKKIKNSKRRNVLIRRIKRARKYSKRLSKTI